MNWSQHYPIARDQFGLSRLAAVSGVEVSLIQTWHHRGVVPVPRIGRGKVRRYDIFEALHLAIVAEMSRLGLSITGAGSTLSEALLGFLRFEIASNGTLDNVASIALVPIDGERDWCVERRMDRALTYGVSFVVIGLRDIVEGVVDRYQADVGRGPGEA